MPDVKRVVLAYSGGLDTSVILRWLIETYRCDVVAFCADLGQGEELIPIRDKARKTGAVAVHVVDLHGDGAGLARLVADRKDRKSTRLNSSHDQISYAV